ncbi:sclerotinia Sclerotiorum agglutinin Ssa in complex with Gal-Beta1,3-Galnac [Nemania serpens]|nr:sclerotinia Sclerotiorum agglutinin Ssa in complex with Gal-Beta1,3-Galnac [Nemania serpens]
MGFTGPGIYEIVPYGGPDLSANAWGGRMEPGAVVRIHTRDRSNPGLNTLWQVALVSEPGKDAEYLIINVLTGYFLTATANQAVTSTPQISPKDDTARWSIISSPTSGWDTFTVNNKVKARGQLNVSGNTYQSGTDILAYPISNTDNTKWYFDPRP